MVLMLAPCLHFSPLGEKRVAAAVVGMGLCLATSPSPHRLLFLWRVRRATADAKVYSHRAASNRAQLVIHRLAHNGAGHAVPATAPAA